MRPTRRGADLVRQVTLAVVLALAITLAPAVTGTSTLDPPTPPLGPEPPPVAQPTARLVSCDRVVARGHGSVERADPGDVVCLEPGIRGALTLDGLEGTREQPITVVNLGGVVEIRAAGDYAGIQISDSRHLRITGSGVTERCGARLPEDDQECGIRVSGSFKGLAGRVRTEHLTVDHVEIGDVENAGLAVHDKKASRGEWVQRGVAFRDLYVHDVGTEGHYHGSSRYTTGKAHLLEGVEIVRNLVVRTGRDGIQVGSAPRDCRIVDNEIREPGGTGEESHAFGIIVNRGSSCDIVGNHIEDSPRSGIYDQGLHGQLIADNTVIASGHVGIDVREGDQAADNPHTPDHPRSTHILRNRIHLTGGSGIRLANADGTDNRIEDNHLTGIGERAIDLGQGVSARGCSAEGAQDTCPFADGGQ